MEPEVRGDTSKHEAEAPAEVPTNIEADGVHVHVDTAEVILVSPEKTGNNDKAAASEAATAVKERPPPQKEGRDVPVLKTLPAANQSNVEKKAPPAGGDGDEEQGKEEDEAAFVPQSLLDLMQNEMTGAMKEGKVNALKLLHTMLKKLADPDSAKDSDNRQIPLSSELLPFVTEYMVGSIGFNAISHAGVKYLRIDEEDVIATDGTCTDAIQLRLAEVENALAILTVGITAKAEAGAGAAEMELVATDVSAMDLSPKTITKSTRTALAKAEESLSINNSAEESPKVIPSPSGGNISNISSPEPDGTIASDSTCIARESPHEPDGEAVSMGTRSVPIKSNNNIVSASIDGKSPPDPDVKAVVSTKASSALIKSPESIGSAHTLKHTVTDVDNAVSLNLRTDPRRKRFGYAQFDVTRIDGKVTTDAFVLVNLLYLTLPKGCSSASTDIKHSEISYAAFRSDNVRFLGNPDTDNTAAAAGDKLGLRFVTKSHIIECFYDHDDPNAIVDEDGTTAIAQLRRFAADFLRLHERWRQNPKNGDMVKESDGHFRDKNSPTPSLSEVKSSPSKAEEPPINSSINDTYRPSDHRDSLMASYSDMVYNEDGLGNDPEIFNEFLSIMQEYNSESIGPDVTICMIANLFNGNDKCVLFLNKLLPQGYAINSSYRNKTLGKVYYVYTSPSGLRTTNEDHNAFEAEMQETSDKEERLDIIRRCMEPMPMTYLEMNKSSIVTFVLALIECKSFDCALDLIALSSTALKHHLTDTDESFSIQSMSSLAGDYADRHEVLAPLYDLRGQVLLEAVKDRFETKQAHGMAKRKAEAESNIIACDMSFYHDAGFLHDPCNVALAKEEEMMTKEDRDFQLALRMSLAETEEPKADTSRVRQTFEDADINDMLDQARDSFQKARQVLETILNGTVASFAAASVDVGFGDKFDNADARKALCTIYMRIAKTYEIQHNLPDSIKWHGKALRLLHKVCENHSVRIAKAHFDLGDQCAKTLIPCPDGSWDKDMKGQMPNAVMHYLSSARSTASLLALNCDSGDSGFIPSPGDHTAEEIGQWLQQHGNPFAEDETKQSQSLSCKTAGEGVVNATANVAEWALQSYSELHDTCRDLFGDAFRLSYHGRGVLNSMMRDIGLVGDRLEMMARHPMFTEEGVPNVGSKKRPHSHMYESKISPI